MQLLSSWFGCLLLPPFVVYSRITKPNLSFSNSNNLIHSATNCTSITTPMLTLTAKLSIVVLLDKFARARNALNLTFAKRVRIDNSAALISLLLNPSFPCLFIHLGRVHSYQVIEHIFALLQITCCHPLLPSVATTCCSPHQSPATTTTTSQLQMEPLLRRRRNRLQMWAPHGRVIWRRATWTSIWTICW